MSLWLSPIADVADEMPSAKLLISPLEGGDARQDREGASR